MWKSCSSPVLRAMRPSRSRYVTLLTRHSPGSRTLAIRTLVYLGLWWIISEAAMAWWQGLLIALLVAWIAPVQPSTWPLRIRWSRLPAFVAFMLQRSIISALTVARIAFLHRQTPCTELLEYHFQILKHGNDQLLMAHLINLTPGTLTVEIAPDRLQVHALGHQPHSMAPLLALEIRLAYLYGYPTCTTSG